MARFYGNVGFGIAVESSPGVWVETITQRPYFGDVTQNSRQINGNDKIVPDLSVSNAISIIADAYAQEHFFTIRFVEWAGTNWVVNTVEVKSPRLILRLGEVYNGPTD